MINFSTFVKIMDFIFGKIKLKKNIILCRYTSKQLVLVGQWACGLDWRKEEMMKKKDALILHIN